MVFTNGNGRWRVYAPDVPASLLACANQYQFCSTDQDHCGPLASFVDALLRAGPAFGTTADELANINLTERVAGRFQRLGMTLQGFPIPFSRLRVSAGTTDT